jgi:hypothetical protein
MFGLMFFPDRLQGLRELVRVLKPGGHAVISSWLPFEGPFALLMEAMKAELPGLPFGQGKGPLSEPADLVQEMRAAGFASVEVTPRTFIVPVPGLTEFWGVIERTMAPLVLLRQRLDEAHWKAFAAGVVARLRGHLGDGPFDMQLRALLGHGRR